MTTIAQYYERANALWPKPLPALTYPEAVRAARRLYRYVRKHKCPWTFREATGRVGTWMGVDGFHINVREENAVHVGWEGLVHSLSHYLFSDDKPHSKGHARLEARMIKQVIRRGWLDGRLKDAAKAPPTPADKDAKEIERIMAGLERWAAKKQRAERAIRKLEKRRKYYVKKAAAQSSGAPPLASTQPRTNPRESVFSTPAA